MIFDLESFHWHGIVLDVVYLTGYACFVNGGLFTESRLTRSTPILAHNQDQLSTAKCERKRHEHRQSRIYNSSYYTVTSMHVAICYWRYPHISNQRLTSHNSWHGPWVL